ncbi:class I SAM-dependent methyltransferase [Bacillus sp. Hm123]|uniref:class I SAM-dependent methyltransferase n=1 Tax=Bacillus sp. Hm123 TaxID=3450745 RepID=UPI003F440448
MNSSSKKPAHLFLAGLGKTVLRPGGKAATHQILNACSITAESKVLEVAPNMGTTAIHIAKTYGATVKGIDINKEAVNKAQQNIQQHELEHLIHIQHGNALQLPFEDETFDIVLNEAMLTMLPDEMKQQALKEYYRVLKSGGILATHDLLIKDEQQVTTELDELRSLIMVRAQPKTRTVWQQLFEQEGFAIQQINTGELHLLSLKGLVHDEGFDGLMTIIQNAQQNEEDEKYFRELIEQFDDARTHFGHITVVACK